LVDWAGVSDWTKKGALPWAQGLPELLGEQFKVLVSGAGIDRCQSGNNWEINASVVCICQCNQGSRKVLVRRDGREGVILH